jgi:hypothetical protein
VAYDTMARRSEVVAINFEDFSFMEEGSGRVITADMQVMLG